jgi:hypothetical protein
MSVTVNGNTYLASADGKIYGQYPAGDAPLPSADLFLDSFEDSTMEVGTVRNSPVNTVNFTWAALNQTTLVTGPPGANSEVYPSTVVVNDGRDWTAKDGSNSLRFNYPSGNHQSEQRFAFDANDDLWIRFWARVPTNFQHGSTNPTNNKFFAIWMDDYSTGGAGSTVTWEFWNDGSDGSQMSVHYSEGNNTSLGPHLQQTDFITYPTDQGRWMQVVIHVKTETSDGADDGVIEMWRRWDNGSFVKYHDITNAGLKVPPSPLGWAAGYFMGWSNPSYSADTEWLIDKIEFGTESLI